VFDLKVNRKRLSPIAFMNGPEGESLSRESE
jgi:hypothetical protein